MRNANSTNGKNDLSSGCVVGSELYKTDDSGYITTCRLSAL
jgi:hypothetical protein